MRHLFFQFHFGGFRGGLIGNFKYYTNIHRNFSFFFQSKFKIFTKFPIPIDALVRSELDSANTISFYNLIELGAKSAKSPFVRRMNQDVLIFFLPF